MRAKNSGIHVIVIGVGDWTDESELMAIASYPQSSNYIPVERYSDLRNFATRMADYICNSRSFLPSFVQCLKLGMNIYFRTFN